MRPFSVPLSGRDEILDAFSSNRWLGDWPDEVRRHLAEAAWIKRYADGAQVHPGGMPLESLRVVVEGALELRIDNPLGTRSVLFFALPGDLVGFNCVFPGTIPTYSVFAYGPTKVIYIPRQTLLDVFQQQPEHLWTMVRYFFHRLQLRTDYIALHATASLRDRIVLQLLQMAREQPNASIGSVQFRLSQETLASLLATSRQSVNRELKKLKDLGFVSYKGGKVIIPSIAKLMQIHDMSMHRLHGVDSGTDGEGEPVAGGIPGRP